VRGIATIVINVVAVSLMTFGTWSDWRTGAALNFVDDCLLVGFRVVRRGALLVPFLLFGIVVGLTELAADAWLVDCAHTLDYSIGGGPMIWRSPLWMPLAWEVVAVQFGYIGLRLWERFGKTDLLMMGLLSAINIPFYERDGASNSLVAIQRLPNDFVHTVVHHRRRIWHCSGVRVASAHSAARFMARRRCCRHRWGSIDFCLLRRRLSAYRSIEPLGEMMVRRILTITVAILSWAAIACGMVPIIVNTPRHQLALGKIVNNAEEQLKKGELAGANRTQDAVLKADLAFWPALYTRARIFVMEGKYERAIHDCNEALRKYRGFVEAAMLRAQINVHLGKYAEASKEFGYLIAIHPRRVTLARVLKQRAWFQATCRDSSFRMVNRQSKTRRPLAAFRSGRMRPRSILLLQLMQRR